MLEISFLAIPMQANWPKKRFKKKDLVQNAAFSLKVAEGKGLEGTFRYENGDAHENKSPIQLLENMEVRLELKDGDVS